MADRRRCAWLTHCLVVISLDMRALAEAFSWGIQARQEWNVLMSQQLVALQQSRHALMIELHEMQDG